MSSEPVQLLDRVAIRFAGDSGDRDEGQAPVIHLHDGEPVRVGADQVVARGDSGELMVVAAQGADQSRVVTHHVDADDPYAASALSRLDDPSMAHVPMVLFRNVSQPTYDDLVRGQVDGAGAFACGHCSSAGRCLPSGASSLGAVRSSKTRMSGVPWNFGGGPLMVRPR